MEFKKIQIDHNTHIRYFSESKYEIHISASGPKVRGFIALRMAPWLEDKEEVMLEFQNFRRLNMKSKKLNHCSKLISDGGVGSIFNLVW